MSRAGRILALLVGLWLVATSPAWAASPFANWSAVVVAGDWHGAGGGATEAFDNARRDVSESLRRAGFQSENVREFSVRPERYADTNPAKAELGAIYETLESLAGKAPDGCLFYMTSHGEPQGALLDNHLLAPAVLADILDRTCGARPTVVVISACFSGVFLPKLALPNRMVMTAARPDRASFGCGQDDKYPYFDDCFLSSMRRSQNFVGLAAAAVECVRVREITERVSPPSEPQVWVGAQLRPLLPLYTFEASSP